MRAFAFALAISVCLSVPAEATPPRRVASLKLCTDELLLLLADPRQIASLTYLSSEPLESPLWRQARRYKRNDGSMLAVVGAGPDLVFDMGGGGGRDASRIARRLGIRLVTLPYPQRLEDIESAISIVAAELGRPAAGTQVLARIAELKRTAPRTRLDTMWVSGGGRSLAADGLGAEWMALSGLKQRRLPQDRITLEQMIASPPVLLLRSQYRAGEYSSEQGWLSHPLVARGRRSRIVDTDGRRWTCMGPLMIGETVRLRGLVGR